MKRSKDLYAVFGTAAALLTDPGQRAAYDRSLASVCPAGMGSWAELGYDVCYTLHSRPSTHPCGSLHQRLPRRRPGHAPGERRARRHVSGHLAHEQPLSHSLYLRRVRR